MPHEASVQPEASTVSVGLGIRYIAKHCYAFSGPVTTLNNAYATLLSFTSGSGYAIVDIILNASTTDNDPAAGLRSNFKITMNDIVVGNFATVSGQGSAASATDVIPFIIPPQTTVVISNRATATTGTVYCQITGRVHGAV